MKMSTKILNLFVPFLYIKRHQKNTQAKVLEKIASRQYALVTIGHCNALVHESQSFPNPKNIILNPLHNQSIFFFFNIYLRQ